jgi:PAS domain S-box-containing protein
MTERSELLEATLDCHPEGIALIGQQHNVVLWNRAAEAITGHLGVDLVGYPVPELLEPLLHWFGEPSEPDLDSSPHPERGCLLHTQHQLGHPLSVFARMMVLRDGLGTRIGAAIIFHPAERMRCLKGSAPTAPAWRLIRRISKIG